jgi:hypothetical protein
MARTDSAAVDRARLQGFRAIAQELIWENELMPLGQYTLEVIREHVCIIQNTNISYNCIVCNTINMPAKD